MPGTLSGHTDADVIHKEVVVGIGDSGFTVEGDVFDTGIGIQRKNPMTSGIRNIIIHFIDAAAGIGIIVPELYGMGRGPTATVADQDHKLVIHTGIAGRIIRRGKIRVVCQG